MPVSRVVSGLIAAGCVAASGIGGAAAAQFVVGSMNPFYGNIDQTFRAEPSRVIANAPAMPASEAFAPMPTDYWSAAPALADTPPPAATDSRQWERESEAEARRWQRHIDAEVREAERHADEPVVDAPAPGDQIPATLAPTSTDHHPDS